ncbi:MAG: hypothetical protein WAS54_02235 [Scrofimicrobium sp.]
MALAPGASEFVCSARECTEPAKWRIDWSNPKIHYGRGKTWLACDTHLEELKGYFTYRNFPYEITVFERPR